METKSSTQVKDAAQVEYYLGLLPASRKLRLSVAPGMIAQAIASGNVQAAFAYTVIAVRAGRPAGKGAAVARVCADPNAVPVYKSLTTCAGVQVNIRVK